MFRKRRVYQRVLPSEAHSVDYLVLYELSSFMQIGVQKSALVLIDRVCCQLTDYMDVAWMKDLVSFGMSIKVSEL